MSGKNDPYEATSPGVWRWILAALVALFAFIVAGYSFRWEWTGFPEATLFNWLQILVFPAAVAAGTFFLNRAAKAREDARDGVKARNEERKAVLRDATGAYNDAKKVRRKLKAHVVTDDVTESRSLSCAVYEEQMQKLIDPQLRFELYKPSDDAHANPFLRAFEDPGDIAARLGGLERYLNSVIKEYTGGKYRAWKSQPKAKGQSHLELEHFPNLRAFLETDTFISEFSSPFRSAAAQMQKEILDV